MRDKKLKNSKSTSTIDGYVQIQSIGEDSNELLSDKVSIYNKDVRLLLQQCIYRTLCLSVGSVEFHLLLLMTPYA